MLYIVAALELSPHVLIRTHLPRPSTGDVYVRAYALASEYARDRAMSTVLERDLTKADGGKY